MLVKDVVNDWLVSLIIDHRSHGGSEIVGAVWHFYPNKKVSACGNEVHPKTQPTGRWDDGAVCTICERLHGERRKPLWNPADYYYTKRDKDRWTVSGRRAHLEVIRTEAPSGRLNRRDEDILQTIFLVESRVSRIDVDDQFRIEPHGFTRLKDALEYAVEKLAEYDDHVDPRKTRKNPGRRAYTEMVHLAVQGPRNITTIGAPGELSNETLEAFAGMVRDRRPGKRYYVVTDTMPKQILYRWHVGEGFSHEEGWWIQ